MAERVRGAWGAQTLKPCKRPPGLWRGKLWVLSRAVNQSAHSGQLCSDITLGVTAIHLNRVLIRDEKPPSYLALLLSMVIFTTTIIRAGSYKCIISKRDQESTKIESKHIEYNKSRTVLIICLFPSAVSSFCIPHSCVGVLDQEIRIH